MSTKLFKSIKWEVLFRIITVISYQKAKLFASRRVYERTQPARCGATMLAQKQAASRPGLVQAGPGWPASVRFVFFA